MWRPTTDKKFGVVIYNFNGSSVKHGLSLEIGETVQILEEDGQGWLRGFSTRNKNHKGVFPSSYVHLKKCKVDNKGQYETVTPVEDNIALEITSVLREWGAIWKKFYLGKDDRFERHYITIRKVMLELIDIRRQIMSGDRTQEQLTELKRIAAGKIDWGNSQMGLDLVPRMECEIADVDKTSVVELFKLHFQSREDTRSTRGILRKNKKRESVPIHHLHCMVEKFESNVGEDVEIFLSLYDAKEGIFISERFMTRKSKTETKPSSHSALYTDLGQADLARDLYVVVHVVRVGRMLFKENEKKKSDQVYRRPYGCGVASINDILSANIEQTDDIGQYVKIFNCVSSEHDFPSLHENIIKKQTSKLNVSNSQIHGIPLSVKMLHGDMNQLRKENPLLFSRGINIVRKLGFADVIMPGDARNDVYITIDRGEFEKGGKTAGKNVEVCMKVYDMEGKQIMDCISVGEGMPLKTDFQSVIYYHSNQPKWNETVKLVIPPEKCQGSHVRFEFRHCSNRDAQKKLYAFGFMHLTRADGATIADGTHEVFVYKCEENHRFGSTHIYLKLPSGPADMMTAPGSVMGNNSYQRNLKENFFITTRVCSTKLPQNLDLVALLRWKDHPERIHHSLNKLTKIRGEDIVKCQDIIDTLFNILDEDTEAYGKPVFQALVYVIGILSDRRYQNLQTDLDTYIEKHFAGTLAHKPLMSNLKLCAEEAVHYADKQEHVKRAFRAIPYLFKFIIQSRLLYARATKAKEESVFKESLKCLFNAMNNMVQFGGDFMLQSQIMLLNNFSSTYDCLLHEIGSGPTVCTLKEVATYVKNLIDCVARENVSSELHSAKLRCILDTVNSRLFEERESRSILLSVFLNHVRMHLVLKQELKLCGEVLGDMLSSLQTMSRKHSVNGEVQLIVQTLLDNLLQTLLTIPRQGELTGQFVACLTCTLKLMREEHFRNLLNSFSDRKPLKEFITRIFIVFRELVKQDVFPQDWMVMRMVTNDVILSAIQYFSQILTSHFLLKEKFDNQLWSSFFNLSVSFLTQPSLQLETFSEVKRNKIKDQYGDMRVLMGHEIESMWHNLGDLRVSFLSLMGAFVEVTLVPETELRRTTLPFFFDMMQCEQKLKGNFRQVESEIIDKLDLLVGAMNKGDEEYRTLFYSILTERLQNQPWKATGLSFVSTVARLLDTLLDYRSVMTRDDEKFKQMSCTMNILKFYKDELKKEDMYKRYIYKLHDLHVPEKNYTEAAFTLRTLAHSLQWSNKPLREDEEFPRQTEWQRKEALYQKIIDLFDKGQTWEQGIPLCKELAMQYESKAFDYAKLGKILRKQADFYEQIQNNTRMETDFFRISFYGLDFPTFLRNKSLVMRARVFERGDGILQMIQTEFPAALVWTQHQQPDEEVLQSHVQYIEVRKVNPIPEEPELFHDKTVPEKILKYYETNDVKKFYFDRPFHRGDKDPNNEFKSLWLDRTRLTISSTIPGILRWFEVVHTEKVEVSPLEHAIETMQKKNKELSCTIATYTSEEYKNTSINPLSMCLNGVIDAAVMGGIKKYQEAFFVPEYAASHPRDGILLDRLKKHILEQVDILDKGLRLHGELAPPDVKPLQAKLENMFASMKNTISAQGSPIAGHKTSTGNKLNQVVPPPGTIPPPSPFTPPDDGTTFKLSLQEPMEPSRRPVSTISTASTGSSDSTSSSGVGTIPEGDEDADELETPTPEGPVWVPREASPILPGNVGTITTYDNNSNSTLLMHLPSANFHKISTSSKTKIYTKDGSLPKVPYRPRQMSRMSSEPALLQSSPTMSRASSNESFEENTARRSWDGSGTGQAPRIPPRPSVRLSMPEPRMTHLSSQSFREDLLQRKAPDIPQKKRNRRSNSVSPTRLAEPGAFLPATQLGEPAPPLPPKPSGKPNGVGVPSRQSVLLPAQHASKPLPPTPAAPQVRKPPPELPPS
ncbi:dedicator of cytokinesis protein 3-like isoform X2 [Ptychodera flava]|uniref:dedicator of cytokinesis protein 3-like isoform X2 n=1 Tax=Ptychodera flava TaxID=63121 RepID=UPI00396A3F61